MHNLLSDKLNEAPPLRTVVREVATLLHGLGITEVYHFGSAEGEIINS